jgi:hypothetical protein
MKVKANTICFIGGSLRQVGDVFDVPEGTKDYHLDPIKAHEPDVEKPKEKRETLTLRQAQKNL